jgi:small subunit ribosomal protein S2
MQKTTDVKELVNDMFAAGAHTGFVRSRRHPSVAKYLHSTRSRKDIINLEESASLLAAAEEFAMTLGRLGKTVIFVGTKPEVKDVVREAAVSVEQPYVTERWLGGTLTNLSEIKKRINRYVTLRDQRDTNKLVYKTKKEKLMLEREITRLERNFKGILW